MKSQIRKSSQLIHSWLISLFMALATYSMVGCSPANTSLQDQLNPIKAKMKVQLAVFDKAHLVHDMVIPLDDVLVEDEGMKVNFRGAEFLISADYDTSLVVKARLLEGELSDFSLGLITSFENWSMDNYVLMPGGVYNGNRYKAAKYIRKHLCKTVECSPDMEPVMTTVPRLTKEGKSEIEFLSGDMSTPSFGVQFPSSQKGLFLMTSQGTQWGDYGYTITESADRTKASFMVRMPALREDSVRLGRAADYPSKDRGASLKSGDEITIEVNLNTFEAPDIQSLYNEFITIRKDIGTRTPARQIPYSAAWQLQEEKYNAQNWVEQYGYYSVGMREVESQDWQTAWTGGLNTVFPLLVNGNEMTRQRVMKTFDFLFDTVTVSGFPFGRFHNGIYRDPHNLSYMRYNGDALYFMVKTYELYQQLYPDQPLPDKWTNGTRAMADAMVGIFEKYGQFGMHINNETGDIVAGGTCASSVGIGGLALCADFYDHPKYLQIAQAAGDYYYENYIKKGFTNGGPGDIFQGQDSESAFGLLESYVVLYEVTQDDKWLQIAREIAHQCATWVVSYDFNFPEQSTFHKLGMLTNGTVIANVQNKHSSPGICSLSGNSLFKLYRYTGDQFYLDLISDIARAIPQYMSREDRPIVDVREGQRWPVMPSGWINERVNLSDWEERGFAGDIKRGEIFGGSTWAEVACMLSYAELPGVYVLKDKGLAVSLDNIDVKVTEQAGNKLKLELSNPTDFDAEVKLFVETSGQQSQILSQNYMMDFKETEVKANSKVTIEL